jgi:hypothetical protein
MTIPNEDNRYKVMAIPQKNIMIEWVIVV